MNSSIILSQSTKDLSMDRRHFLKILSGGATFLGLSGSLFAGVDPKSSLVNWGRLKFPLAGSDQMDWGVHPQGDLNLIDYLTANTSLQLPNNWNVADVWRLDEMVQFPFLYMHAEDVPVLDSVARANLREYLLRGGFIFAEDCVIGRGTHGHNSRNDFFFRSMVEQLPAIMPEAKLERLPNDHPVFHVLYHLDNGMPHMQGIPHGLHALTLHGRVLAFISPSDLHCGWTNGYKWFGAEQTQQALRMGTNIYVFAMTQSA
ncbi:MAG TPA: DUF4159 domain-containing protein [Chthoniobacterales bacterium]